MNKLLEDWDRRAGEWVAGRCFSIDELQDWARRRVPRAMFDYMEGAADDEVTLARNRASFSRYQLVPRFLRDVSEVDTSTQVLGRDIALPLMFSPTGGARLFHYLGERATAPAAAEAGLVYTLSTAGTASIEEVAAFCPGRKWFQVYVFRDRSLVGEFISLSRASGYEAMVLTVDLPVAGNRHRDARNGMQVPPRFTARTLLDFALHPTWALTHLADRPVSFPNFEHRVAAADAGALAQFIGEQMDPGVTWEDAAAMAQQWGGPFILKGILSVDDARRAADMGAAGIVLSNHGGRQLDHSPAAFDVLPEIAEAVGDRLEIYLDGGVRRGTDIIKALALGAKACMIGRGYLFGLGAAGPAGVRRAITLLAEEFRRDMQLLGCTSVAEIGPEVLRRISD